MRILAVDDEPLFLDILDVALKGLGFDDVSHAYSAQDALLELETSRKAFDCILLDIRMPGMDGIELCRKIRAMSRYRRVPVMMVTSMADRHYIDNAFAAGATDYLGKPIDTTELKVRMAMMERLVLVRLRNQLLEDRVAEASKSVELKFDLETPVMIEGFSRGIEFLAMENYLLSLGIKKRYESSAFAISISNVAKIFNNTSPSDFMSMLSDVTICIEEAMKSVPGLISYAGNGNFVVVTSGYRSIDSELIEVMINVGLDELASIYQPNSVPSPKVVVGSQVRNSVFSRARQAKLLECAIAQVHARPAHATLRQKMRA